jgi:hypothetical protein
MKGVRVASLPVLTEAVASQLECGEITRSQAERMIGFLHLETAGASCERRTWYRRLHDNRSLIVVVIITTPPFKPNLGNDDAVTSSGER